MRLLHIIKVILLKKDSNILGILYSFIHYITCRHPEKNLQKSSIYISKGCQSDQTNIWINFPNCDISITSRRERGGGLTPLTAQKLIFHLLIFSKYLNLNKECLSFTNRLFFFKIIHFRPFSF